MFCSREFWMQFRMHGSLIHVCIWIGELWGGNYFLKYAATRSFRISINSLNSSPDLFQNHAQIVEMLWLAKKHLPNYARSMSNKTAYHLEQRYGFPSGFFAYITMHSPTQVIICEKSQNSKCSSCLGTYWLLHFEM